MTYRMDYAKGENLTPEEEEVYEAMKAAEYQDPDFDDPDWRTLFTPFKALYDEYLGYVFNLRYREMGTTDLTPEQFGLALRRVYGVNYWPAADRPMFTGRRRLNRKRVIGVYGLKGPETVRLPDEPGRRPKTHDYFVD